jgi:hypothetical protein
MHLMQASQTALQRGPADPIPIWDEHRRDHSCRGPADSDLAGRLAQLDLSTVSSDPGFPILRVAAGHSVSDDSPERRHSCAGASHRRIPRLK